MYQIILRIHSLTPYLFLVLMLAVLLLSFKAMQKGTYSLTLRALARVTLILAHLQLVFGLILLAFGDYARAAFNQGMGNVMSNAELRLALVEHPLTMIIGIALITIGFARSKRTELPKAKNRNILVFYGIALVLMLSRLPYAAWFNL